MPIDIAADLIGHDVAAVSSLGWQGIKNGELLLRSRGQFDVLITMDRNLEFQHNISAFSIGVIVVHAHSNRMIHLRPILPMILDALKNIRPGETRNLGA